GKVLFLSECGGYTRSLDMNGGRKTYGYGKAGDEKALTDMISGLYEKMVLPSIENGLSGVVYTQISDVEGEINGIWSSDRKVLKADGDRLKKLFKRVYERFEEKIR
ncbi:MAG: glycoside hydrolase family 2, partial [Clostridia bacterium]|nr:glycoside hydrolase family 2 [Clostridia bacterium]